MRYWDRAGSRREEPTADWKEAHKKLRERLQARRQRPGHRPQGRAVDVPAVGDAIPGELSAGGVADEWVTQLLRQGDAKVFMKYSQMQLQMKREALQKLNRTANESAGALGQVG
jgi:hypothetical protein